VSFLTADEPDDADVDLAAVGYRCDHGDCTYTTPEFPAYRNHLTRTHNVQLLQAEPWMADGACRNHPDAPWLWFPHQGGDTDTPKAICAGCPVRQQCLTYALDTNQTYGVWGGTSERERRRIRKQRRAS